MIAPIGAWTASAALAACGLAACPARAWAEPATTAPGEISYPASFYAALGVQTALDVLARTPGFVLDAGSDVRGFGAAAGNVLIDGERPTVKSGGVTAVLRHIPASRVERVVLIGGGLAAQAQGQVLVANLVLTRDETDGEGNAILTLARQRNGWIAPSVDLSYSRALGRWAAEAGVAVTTDREDVRGLYVMLDPDGAVDQVWRERAPSQSIETALTGGLSGSAGGGDLAVNLRLGQDWFRDRVRIDVHGGGPQGALLAARRLTFDEAYRELELGGDWSRRIGPGWSGKIVLLARPSRDRTDQGGVSDQGRTVSTLRQQAFEGVARATLARQGDHAWLPELGLEASENRLRSRLAYAEDVGQGLVDTPLPGSDTLVSERRAEGFANLTMRPATRWRLEGGVAAEWSRIRVSGDIANAQTLIYLKPSIAVSWNPTDRLQLRGDLKRTVDQLDFGDFAASVEAVEDRPISGNAALRPARVTRGAVRLDHRWRKSGALTLEGFHEWRRGVLDYVPTVSGGQAVGVAGDAHVLGLTVRATLPLDAWLVGARLTADGTWRRSRLRDPLSSAERPLSGLPDREVTLSFRQDVARLRSAWGLDVTGAKTVRTYYVDEQQTSRATERWNAYVETSAVEGLRLTFSLRGLTGSSTWRRRDFFEAPGGAYAGSQLRRRDRGMQAVLKVVRPL